MFRAIDLRRLGKNAGAAVADQEIAGRPKRRIRGDAGIGVRAAALKRYGQVRCRNRLAHGRIGSRQHLADDILSGFDGFARAARSLHGHGLEKRAALDLIGIQEEVDLVDLAAEADHEDAGEVGVARIAPKGALQGIEAVAAIGHAAAGSVGQRNNAVNVGIARQLLGREGVGDEMGNGRRAIHRREHADEIPRPRLAVVPKKAVEGGAFGFGQEGGGLGIGTEGIVAGKVLHLDILHMHMVAGRDVLGGKADDLVIFSDSRALCDRPHGDLMARGYTPKAGDVLTGDRRFRLDIDTCGDDIVVFVQTHGQLLLGHAETSLP